MRSRPSLFNPKSNPSSALTSAYYQVLGSPQQPYKLLRVLEGTALSRQRSRVRVSSSPPFIPQELRRLRSNQTRVQKDTFLHPFCVLNAETSLPSLRVSYAQLCCTSETDVPVST